MTLFSQKGTTVTTSKTDKKPTEGTDVFEGVFKDYAPTVYILPGDKLMGTFVKVALGPANEYGRPPVVTFTALAGSVHSGAEDDSPVIDLVPGDEYSLWLLTTVARNSFAEAKPTEGERFAFTNHGVRESRNREVVKEIDGKKVKVPATYHDFEVAFPDRESVTEVVDWDSLVDAPE